ncbi:M15 family metallopeptidase [Hymenobacter sp. BT635]|uniref:M15 family metallopeptidase n=1 Tax=Hymenobacter nitidus TaxID=2880929 RepID=A0ABS8AJ06_9BACT|nr:M15 family metallopeptidase [Hymenobacter nitidus]MCB2380415.1 M15 family metallopeptidase [Hymenobacter nitidus]
MTGYSDRVPIPPKDTINTGLSAARESTMLATLGSPGKLSKDCSEPADSLRRRLVSKSVGPFRVEGFDFAVESLVQLFAEVKQQQPDLFQQVKTAGVLCVRHRRTNPTRFSNHSWGTAIDIYFGPAVLPQGTALTHRGNLMLAPYFNRHGWYWGAEFSGDSVDSMHFELAEETILKLGRKSEQDVAPLLADATNPS